MQKLTIAIAAMLALACYDKNGLGGGMVGPASLDIVYLRYRIPVVYVLFVSDIGSPGAPGAWEGGGSAGAWDAELHKSFTDHTTGARIEAQPIVIRGATLRTGGKSFDLTRGNVLVAHMNASGALTVTQLPGRRGADEPDIVSIIKAALPRDVRVQALPLS